MSPLIIEGCLGGQGLTVAIKDTLDVAGWPTRCGSRAFETAAPAEKHATVVQALLDSDWQVVGKTVLHELAFGVTGINEWAGTPINPQAPERIPGDSSSGSAMIVAQGAVDVALGTDTDCLDKSELPLVSLRVEEYAGMLFATFKADIEPLVDFLSPAKKWMDLFMKQGAGYPIKVPGEHRFHFPGNWKIQLENTTDAYQFPLVHKSFLSSVDEETLKLFDFVEGPGYVEDLGNGHSVTVMIPDLVELDADLDKPIPERFEGLVAQLRDEGIEEQQVRRTVRAVGGSGFNLNLFPNVACLMAFFRVLQLISVTETEIHHSVITMNGGPAVANRYRLRLHEHFQGPMGFGTPNDSEAWGRVQKGACAEENLWIMLNRGLPGEKSTEDGLRSDVSAETGMRAAYQQWQKMMSA